jgi:Peptidase S46
MKLRMLLLVSLAAAPVAADEGLWLFNQFPKDQIKTKYSVDITDQFVENLRLASLRIGGASGAFVSPKGLILTSRRAVAECAAKTSDVFYAAVSGDETKCANLTADVLVSLEDITKQVRDAASDKTKPAEALEKRNAAVTRIEKACAEKNHTICSVVKLSSGERYDLYQYKRYADLRLVFAPELAAASFGGNPSELTYPRYSMDFAFLRAYENDNPAATSHYLKWSEAGVKDGDLVFAAGSPVTTSRLATAAQLTFYQTTSMPYAITRLQNRIADLRAAAPQSAALLALGAEYKLTVGKQIGLKDEWLMARKQNFERKLRSAVEHDPKLGMEAGKVWDQVATAYKNWTPTERRYQLLEKPAAAGSVLFRMARATVRSEPAPPAAPIDEAAEIALLTRYLDELKQVGERDLPMKKAGRQGEPAMDGQKEVPMKAILGSKTSAQAATDMVHAGVAGVIPLAKAVDEAGKKVAKTHAETIDALEVSAAERIEQFRFRLFGAADYPDATATPRLTFGVVKGYRDRTEAPVPFATTFGGLFHFTAAQAPFLLPQRWTDARATFGMVTPMDFVSTCDITAGPSGAPVVNQNGEIVGVTFDGNIESIAITYLYEDEKARAVHVASQGIVESLQKVYKAQPLLRELGAAATPTSAIRQ